jgi:hypothetical protein
MEEIEANGRYGNGLQAASKKGVPGLYNTQNKAMGNSTGLRQYYRYGLYSESPFHPYLCLPIPWAARSHLSCPSPGAPVVPCGDTITLLSNRVDPLILAPHSLPAGARSELTYRRMRIPKRRSWNL